MKKNILKKIEISGVNNPLLIINGIYNSPNSYIEVEIDNVKISANSKKDNELLFFEYEYTFDKNASDIKIYLVHNKEKQLLVKKKTSITKRKISKIFGMIRFQFIKILVKFNVKKEKNNYYDPYNIDDYNEWITRQPMNLCEEKFLYNPLISIVTPVYNVKENYLSMCIDSVLSQTYNNFELILVDDFSTEQETLNTLKRYENVDSRIKVIYRKNNGNISEATNTGFDKATGDYIGLLDNDDTLSSDALYEVVKAINKNKKIDFIYTDEDKIDLNGRRCVPYFKSDFSPDTLLSNNYICHFTVFSKELLNKTGGEKSEYNGAQDYDLILRMTEQAKCIHHISKILYHWRIIPGSTSESIASKEYAINAGKKAIEDALKRRKIDGNVKSNNDGTYIVNYKINNPHVTIIIPTKDLSNDLKKCIDSIYNKASYKNYDILIVNNNSEEKETFELFDYYKKKYNNFNVIDINCPFNYSYLMNEAVKVSKGDYLLFLNNDTEVITANFIEQMVMYASRKHIGMVGVKLLFSDNTIQHGGVVLGILSMAGHAYENLPLDYPMSFGKLNMPCNYAAVTMACAMISKDKYNELHGLDTKLANNYNDVEFNIRLLKHGYYNVFLGHVKLYHYESKTRGVDKTKEQFDKTAIERNYVLKKHQKLVFNDPFYNDNFSKTYMFKLEKNK